MATKDSKNKKSTIKAKEQPVLRKDQEQLLQYYAALPAKDRKDALKFMKMIAGSYLPKRPKKD